MGSSRHTVRDGIARLPSVWLRWVVIHVSVYGLAKRQEGLLSELMLLLLQLRHHHVLHVRSHGRC